MISRIVQRTTGVVAAGLIGIAQLVSAALVSVGSIPDLRRYMRIKKM